MTNPNLNILIIDTASEHFSLALISKEGTSSFLSESPQSHAKNLTLEIDKILKNSQISFQHLDAIAINKGPGSFTGLRVASSVAKGICIAMEIPLIAIAAMEEYARNMYINNKEKYSEIFVTIDARRGNFFYSHCDESLSPALTGFINEVELKQKMENSKNPFLISNKDEKFYQFCNAEKLKSSVLKAFEEQKFEDVPSFEPNYYLETYTTKAK